ncbi:hypothetical protein EJ08DRAFT_665285 [Tothia fuscella]|uniref:Uncharacterized protein n=1 Tax=Tothia fuscella TaxID=1048955 RepID=A0A9P4TU44_9PEZI|nr:hypothetical protein EJ08DRAFT_665285 [Tothia fuscella]
MPPKTRSAKKKTPIEDQTYSSRPTKKQAHFPIVRKTVHPKTSEKATTNLRRGGALSKLRKNLISDTQLRENSTLTQLGFDFLSSSLVVGDSEEESVLDDEDGKEGKDVEATVSLPKKRKRQCTSPPISSSMQKMKQWTITQAAHRFDDLADSEEKGQDEDESEVEEHEKAKPSKKRKRKSTNPPASCSLKQPTYTQAVRTFKVPAGSREEGEETARPVTDSGSRDDFYTDVSDHAHGEKWDGMEEWVETQPKLIEEVPDSETSIQPPPIEGPPRSTSNAFSSSPARAGPDGMAIPRTPKRFFAREIPSSQTPPYTPLSTQKTPRRFEEVSPLKRKLMDSQRNRASPRATQAQNSPLKERSTNTILPQALPAKSRVPASPLKKVIALPQPVRDATHEVRRVVISPRLGIPVVQTHQNSPQGSPTPKAAPPCPVARTDDESPTKKRVREFNARYAALSRQGSGISSRRAEPSIYRGKVIRSSTGFTSLEDSDTATRPPQAPVETQYGSLGEETQALLLASGDAIVPVDAENVVEEDEEEMHVGPGRRSPILHREESNGSGSSHPDASAIPTAAVVDWMETQIKEEQQSLYSGVIVRDFQPDTMPDELFEGVDENRIEEERIPSSQNELDAFSQKPCVNEGRSRSMRVIEDSQLIDEIIDDDEESQDDPVETYTNDEEEESREIHSNKTPLDHPASSEVVEDESQDPASRQLLHETQLALTTTRVSSSPPTAEIARVVKPALPTTRKSIPMFPKPATQRLSNPTQATTMDETQLTTTSIHHNHHQHTQLNLPSSPVLPTQSTHLPFSPHNTTESLQRSLRSSPQGTPKKGNAFSILVPSSPVPLPPAMTSDINSSSPPEMVTPNTKRYLKRAPVTISQLLPDSLEEMESFPCPPGWMQDEDDVDDDEL